MTPAQSPAFATLQRRYRQPAHPHTSDRPIALAAFDDGHLPAHDPRAVLKYLRDMGLPVASLDDLNRAIASLHDEEELAAHWCREGLAVSHASDGAWFLFMENAP